MIKTVSYGSLLLLSTALVTPAAALAQGAIGGGSAPSGGAGAGAAAPATTTAPAGGNPGVPGATDSSSEQIETSTPGADSTDADIVVVGRNIPNIVRSTPEVVSVLSSADIARSGEGDIAGALQRVTGLSVVGNGFVYVRGLGDRYSLALLNGSPLPSPEPLRRVVPLDIFPTNVIASSLVQKSYSVNYPGEFGGGVINLTTKAIPSKPFLSLGISGGIDTETTAKLGYTYYGSDLDWAGFDDGTRKLPRGLRDAINSGQPITEGAFTRSELQGFAASLRNAQTTLLQRNDDIPGNFSADLSAGTSFPVGDGNLGVTASAGYSSTWRTRDARQQLSNDPLLQSLQSDQKAIITDNRVVVNGLVGIGYEFGDQKIRWTNLYIHDTVKQARLAAGYNANVGGADPVASPDFFGTPPLLQQNTSWFERQLIDTQAVGEFKFGDLNVDLRGTFANSKRKSPYERELSYAYSTTVNDYVNNLSSGGQNATIAFSDLDEKVYSGGIDLAYRIPGLDHIKASAGYNYNKTDRNSERRLFQFQPPSALGQAVSQERPDYLLSDYNVYTYGIRLIELTTGQGAAAYDASLRVHAGYFALDGDAGTVRANVGVRYEDGDQTVLPVGAGVSPTGIKADYWLPAATITWNFAPDMQLRLHSSKTIARPQFRELARQLYQDFEADREFTGNPFLKDSTLYNAEARYEWFFGREQRLTIAGFYKQIKNPIEPVPFFAGGGQLRTSFTNAPKAELYGVELEAQKHIPLEGLGGDFFASRRLVLIGNYTYTKSKLKVSANDLVVDPNSDLSAQLVSATSIFQNGKPLTGQSDHLVNVQLGLEDTDTLSQMTVLLNYASNRVTQRGIIGGTTPQPDFVERPGLRVDFVARQGFDMLGAKMELKFEARNLTGRKYQEFQQLGDRRVDINTYDLGSTFSLGLGVNF